MVGPKVGPDTRWVHGHEVGHSIRHNNHLHSYIQYHIRIPDRILVTTMLLTSCVYLPLREDSFLNVFSGRADLEPRFCYTQKRDGRG